MESVRNLNSNCDSHVVEVREQVTRWECPTTVITTSFKTKLFPVQVGGNLSWRIRWMFHQFVLLIAKAPSWVGTLSWWKIIFFFASQIWPHEIFHFIELFKKMCLLLVNYCFTFFYSKNHGLWFVWYIQSNRLFQRPFWPTFIKTHFLWNL